MLVLTLTLALLVSVAHCATCDVSLAAGNVTAVTSLDDTSSAPAPENSAPAPEKEVPACSGHCLSHVTTLSIVNVVAPADIVHRAPPPGREQSPNSIAGLPLFKPPRA